ncbi:MAG: undecaprenyl-diphosphate phosphatase [Planctomycetes bacterium]|nr:undecaprenyl-diphosphate phosphatase [Planctomycetota bacterium]
MTSIDSILLGLVQGVGEFLPISSSGHLTLGQYLLSLDEPTLTLNLALHLATLIVILLAFRKKITAILFPLDFSYIKALIITSIPTAIIGLLIKKKCGVVFDAPIFPAILLCLNGSFLIFLHKKNAEVDKVAEKDEVTKADKVAERNGATDGENLPELPSTKQCLIIGLAQGFAAFPGISRSGSTIGAARLMGISPGIAAEFSLLASIPVILGALLLECRDFSSIQNPDMVILGSVVAGVSGWFSVKILLNIVKKGAYKAWGLYCIAVGVLFLIGIHV